YSPGAHPIGRFAMKTKLLALAAVFSLAGCATVKVAHPRADNVKKVAIVAYTGDVDLRTEDEKQGKGGGIGGMVNGIKAVSELGSGEIRKTRTEEAEKGYQMLAKKLTEGAGWEVLDKDQLAKNDVYSKR